MSRIQQREAVSVVIPCLPGAPLPEALAALKALPEAEKALISEVWVVRGRNPSRQRNCAAQKAGGDWLWFLDDDARPRPGTLSVLLEAAKAFSAGAAGGPNVAPADETPLGTRLDAVLTSPMGSGISRARYTSVGKRRLAGEKELILCNFLVQRQAFLGLGGFCEELFPNEENEFLNRWNAAGFLAVYEPAATVERPRRGSVGAFALQAFRYGRGRAQQVRRSFRAGDLVNLAALGLPCLWAGCLAAQAWGGGTAALGRWVPLAYAGAAFLSAGLRPSVAIFLILRHHAYAAGLAVGCFQEARVAPGEPSVERLSGWE
jgi:glycosyltransferase involved in cell wall biosynthesis